MRRFSLKKGVCQDLSAVKGGRKGVPAAKKSSTGQKKSPFGKRRGKSMNGNQGGGP